MWLCSLCLKNGRCPEAKNNVLSESEQVQRSHIRYNWSNPEPGEYINLWTPSLYFTIQRWCTGQVDCSLTWHRLVWWTLAFQTLKREAWYPIPLILVLCCYSCSTLDPQSKFTSDLSDQSSCSQQWSIQGFVCLPGSLCWLADVH